MAALVFIFFIAILFWWAFLFLVSWLGGNTSPRTFQTPDRAKVKFQTIPAGANAITSLLVFSVGTYFLFGSPGDQVRIPPLAEVLRILAFCGLVGTAFVFSIRSLSRLK